MENSVFVSRDLNCIIDITKMVTLHYFEFPQDYNFDGERHNFWELLYVDKGEFMVKTEHSQHILKQGDAIFHQPNEFHSNHAYNSTGANVFVISFVCTSVAINFFAKKVISLEPKYKKIIMELIETGRETYSLPIHNPNMKELILKQNSLIGGQQLIKLYLEKFLILLLQENNRKLYKKAYLDNKDFNDTLTDEIVSFLTANIYNVITMKDVCSHVNYGKTYISCYFKNYTGKSIIEYYRILKITEAKRLIREKKYTLTQISDMLAFNDPHYFSRTFKKIVSTCPKEYMLMLETYKTEK